MKGFQGIRIIQNSGRLLRRAIISILVLVLVAGAAYWQGQKGSLVKQETIAVKISNEAVIEKLYAEGMLNVLEAKGRANYQLEDPGTIRILNRAISIPGRQKVVSIKYEYKAHWGIDLTSLKADDVIISESGIQLHLPRPQMTGIEIYNDKAQTTGGCLTFKGKPRDDLVEMKANQDEYINILREFVSQDLQESGKHKKLQQVAMKNTVDLLTRLLRELSQNNNLELSIKFI